MTFQRLFDAERTTLHIRLATGIDRADAISEVVVALDGEFTDAEVDSFIASTGTDYWWTERDRQTTSWGGASSTADIVLHIAIWAANGSFWALFGVAIDRLLDRANAPTSPPPEEAEQKARQTIVTKYGELAVSLALREEAQDDHEGTRTYTYGGGEGDYEVTVRSTPKGRPYVSAISKRPRPEHQIH